MFNSRDKHKIVIFINLVHNINMATPHEQSSVCPRGGEQRSHKPFVKPLSMAAQRTSTRFRDKAKSLPKLPLGDPLVWKEDVEQKVGHFMDPSIVGYGCMIPEDHTMTNHFSGGEYIGMGANKAARRERIVPKDT